MNTIDDATPEDWNDLKVKGWGWKSNKGVKISDKYDLDGPDQHPLFPTKDSEKAMVNSYKEKINNNFDSVDKPAHYNNGSVECIDSIQAMLTPDEFIGYLRGNSHKYRWRFRYKNKPIEDLRKARWYEDRLMQFLVENEDVLG